MDLEEIKEREQAETPGKWYVIANDAGGHSIFVTFKGRIYKIGECYASEDAAFIAHARTDIPALIAEVERLTARADQSALNYQQKCRDVEELENSVERFLDQHKCDVHNISAMQATLDQQVKNCEKLIESYKGSNLEQATENYELEQENTTLKKALEIASEEVNTAFETLVSHNVLTMEHKASNVQENVDAWIQRARQAQQLTHETHGEAEK